LTILTEVVKDISQSVNEKVQKLHGVVLLEVSKPEVAKLLIVGFFVLVLENFKASNSMNLELRT
jgi:hypothetical protein